MRQVPLQELEKCLRSSGFRVTPQRRAVLRAVTELGHATPEKVCAFVRQHPESSGPAAVDLSTVYRALKLMEQLGVLRRAPLTHGAMAYLVACRADQMLLICRGCGAVAEADVGPAYDLADILRASSRFEADLTGLTLSGTCAQCLTNDSRSPDK